MANAEICLICKGTGVCENHGGNDDAFPTQKCHGCDGKGWVEVGGELYAPFMPMLPCYPYPGWPVPHYIVTYGDTGTSCKPFSENT